MDSYDSLVVVLKKQKGMHSMTTAVQETKTENHRQIWMFTGIAMKIQLLTWHKDTKTATNRNSDEHVKNGIVINNKNNN